MSGPVEHVTRFEVGEYTADLLKAKTPEDGWYAVVQPRHSRQIVAIDRYPTYDAAKNAVLQTLKLLHKQNSAAD